MSVLVGIDIDRAFAVQAAPSEVFRVLADVPESASHFPKLQRLVDLGNSVYRWEMEKMGLGPFSLQTVYASRYVWNRAKRTVAWTPVEGEGNALVSGSWKISPNAGSPRRKSTRLVLRILGQIELSLPRLMQGVAAPLVRLEFESLVGQYVANLTGRFGGAA